MIFINNICDIINKLTNFIHQYVIYLNHKLCIKKYNVFFCNYYKFKHNDFVLITTYDSIIKHYFKI